MSKIYLPVRLSHLLRHCSVGAIVRGPHYLVTVKDTRKWVRSDGSPAGRRIPYVDQVRSALGIEQELREPPMASEGEYGQVEGVSIPAMRFPAWMICPSCGMLHYKPWFETKESGKPRCRNEDKNQKGEARCKSHPELEQVPWVMVHAEGHMGDVPWHWLAHSQAHTLEQKQCAAKVGHEPYLTVGSSGSSRKVRCKDCRASAPFPDSLRWPYGKTWRQPWLAKEAETTEELAEIVEVNDTRVHQAISCSAIVIPPESRIRKGSIVDRLYSSSNKIIQLRNAKSTLKREGAIRLIASEYRCSSGEIKEAIKKIDAGYPLYGKQITTGMLLENEYRALVEPIPDLAEDEDFVTEHWSEGWIVLSSVLDQRSRASKIVHLIENLISISRLKEIMVLKGFSRLGGEPVPPDIEEETNWLPALELYGEGVFFSLKESSISLWERNEAVRARAEILSKRFEQYTDQTTCAGVEPQTSPRFLLLHTLSHLLIRQLETSAGYPAASLKERIYSSSGPVPMAGVLVYVAVPDISGSLGGLAELAEPERFLQLTMGVFDHADWCSLDPVCAEHEGQGPNQLNRAACHACALVPEPSCAFGNILLDRSFIKGDMSSGMPGILDFMN